MFISPAYAQAAGGDPASSLTAFVPLVLIFVVFYFLMIRPQQKRMKDHKAMLDAIAARRDAGVDVTQGVSIQPAVPPSSGSVAQTAERAALAAMSSWATAWMNGDVASYLESYAPDFKPADGRSHADWAKLRTSAISKAKDINLVISAQQVEVRDAKTISIDFHQSYSSSSYRDEVEKIIVWQSLDGKWKIVSETIKTTKSALDKNEKSGKGATAVNPVLSSEIPKFGSEKGAINAWVDAWNGGDAAKFAARYAVDFSPSNGLSRSEWVTQEMRKSAFSHSKGIRMSVSDVAVSSAGDGRSNATLTQHYESADYKQNVNKELLLGRESGDWKIFKEAIVSLPEATAKPQRALTVNVPGLPLPPDAQTGSPELPAVSPEAQSPP